MTLKALATGAILVGALGISSAGFAQQPAAPAGGAPCAPEGFQGGFSRGCPQREFANPSDIAAMMAALPDKPIAAPKKLRRVLVLARAVGWVHTSIPLA